MALSAGTYWHPLNLPHYITLWDFSSYEEVLVTAVVRSFTPGASVMLRAVWASTHAEMLAGDWEYLGDGVECTAQGFFSSGWAPIPSGARVGEAWVGMVFETDSDLEDLAFGSTDVRVRTEDAGASGCTPETTIAFGEPSPGLLTPGGSYFGDWKAADTNFGYTKEQVEGWISSALDDSRGWQRAGITFRQTESAPVTFQVVEEANCPGEADLGCTEHFVDGTALVTLEASRFGAIKIVNHEAAHAFFYATHTGNGVMNTPGEPEKEWPSACDIVGVRAWLQS